MNLEELRDTELTATVKGMPYVETPVKLRDVASMRWNLLAGDLPIPVATLDRVSLLSNSRWMRSFTERHGVRICPHGKTTMAPQLFELQLDDGAWGITVASVQQMRVCRRFGIRRILMANQLVGEPEMRAVFREINCDPDFDFYCLVDSEQNVRDLHRVARDFPLERPLQVLIEGGVRGGRAGYRDVSDALALARLLADFRPQLALCGVEGFEGIIEAAGQQGPESRVDDFLRSLATLLDRMIDLGLIADRVPILSIGGSIYFDLAATDPKVQALRNCCTVVLRSGCYLTHDSGMLTENLQRVRARTEDPLLSDAAFRPALHVWGRIQSMPEPGLAILNVGKRDVSYDVDLPVAEKWFRPGVHALPVAITWEVRTTQINDQHTFLRIPAESALRIGDVVALGVSHPCTTFDKWKLLYLVNDEYDVVDGILTFF